MQQTSLYSSSWTPFSKTPKCVPTWEKLQLLWTSVMKRKREQREMAPVNTAFTNRAVQLPRRNTWTNNLGRETERANVYHVFETNTYQKSTNIFIFFFNRKKSNHRKCEILTPLKMPCTHKDPKAQSLASGNFLAGRTAWTSTLLQPWRCSEPTWENEKEGMLLEYTHTTNPIKNLWKSSITKVDSGYIV